MKNLSRLVVLATLMALLVVPVMAQDGEGGVVVFGTFGSGPDTLNPVYCTGTDCRDVLGFMYVGLLGVDPEIANYAAGIEGSLAETLELADDNRTFTLTLRDDLFWSDGTPVSMDDVMFKWDIITNPESNYPYPYAATDYIESVEAVDDSTLVVTLWEAQCDSTGYLSYLNPDLPAHVFGDTPMGELEAIINPEITSGPFQLAEWRQAEVAILSGWDEYPDSLLGYVNPDGIIQRVVADQTVMLEEFLAPSGTLNVIEGPPPDRKSDIRAAAEAGTHQMYSFFPGDSWDYMGFNLADPNNPQPAFDENGDPIEQGLHPVFSDKLVRQAIGHAIDIDAIMEGAVFGEGTRMAAQIVNGSWAHDETLQPRPLDVELAIELLAEAGWVPEDAAAAPGPDNKLVCQGCLYATEVDPDFEGSYFEFELITNAGNTRREAIGTIIQDELSRIGMTVDFQTIEFNTLLDLTFGGQTFDAYILGWLAGYPDAPDTTQLFGAVSDDPASQGSNVTSFHNEEYYALETAALTVPGCDQEERAAIYHQMEAIMYDEMPYLWLYAQDGMYAARANVSGFDPYPQLLYWNVDAWSVASE